MKRLLCTLLMLTVAFVMPLTASTTNSNAMAPADESIPVKNATATDPLPQLTPKDVNEVFPTCDNLRDLGRGWFGVMKADKLIGYAAQSKPASNGITGYKGETPLILCFNKDQKIIRVLLMDNMETPSFVARVVKGGLLDSWNGKKVKEAMDVTPDAISGATYTSRSIIASMQAALKQLSTVQPSIVKSHPKGVVLITLAAILGLLSIFTIRNQRGQQKNMEKAAALAKEAQQK